jgi:hypothetical protein
MLTKEEQLIGFQNGFIIHLSQVVRDYIIFLLEIQNHLISESEFQEKNDQLEQSKP